MKLNLQIPTKNKYKRIMEALVVVFVLGLFMILTSNNSSPKKVEQTTKSTQSIEQIQQDVQSYSDAIKAQLEEELTKIDGVGKVEVMLTMKTKGEIVLNKDMPYTTSTSEESDHDGGTRESKENEQQEQTVIVNNSDGSEQPIIIKEYLPEVSGILIIAEGGDQPTVKNNLINAAKVLLDLPAHKIEVMKMVTNKGENK